MARKGLCLLLAAALLFGAPAPRRRRRRRSRKEVLNLLAVNKALQEGKEALKRGDYQAAVTVLESRIAYIDGNKAYLDALRDAYLGYIRELKKTNRTAEIAHLPSPSGVLRPRRPSRNQRRRAQRAGCRLPRQSRRRRRP